MRLLEQPYIVPPGKRDFPFAYVFQPPSTLVTGNNYLDIQIPLQGDSDFVLRHIAGIDTVIVPASSGGRWNYKRHSRQYAIGNQSTGIVPFPNWPVVPETTFTFNEAIWLDLYDFSQAFNLCGRALVTYGSVAFFGVKRFNDDQGYRTQVTPYKYKEMPQRYEFTLTLNQAYFATGTTTPNPPIKFIQQMDNYDFELLRITIGQNGVSGTLQTQDFAITLYDANNHQTSNLPLPQGYINAGKPTPQTQPPYQACFPVPTLVYPAGSAITFDVTSLLCSTQLPQTYNISFEGIWRLPC